MCRIASRKCRTFYCLYQSHHIVANFKSSIVCTYMSVVVTECCAVGAGMEPEICILFGNAIFFFLKSHKLITFFDEKYIY